jgi:2-oxoisovalerate dehydrogenase E2 component (dihydrolipoyl transacylase)
MSEHIFKLPDLGEGTVESEIGEWFINVGEFVEEETVIGTMMTDKAAVEVASPISGTVVKLAGEPGDIVAVGAALVVFETDGEVAASEPQPTTSEKGSDPFPDTNKKGSEPFSDVGEDVESRARVVASPAIRRRAREAGIDLKLVPGTGAGGRIQRRDFDNYLKSQATGTPIARTSAPSTAVKEIKVIGLRRIIAERMTKAKQEIPHFAYVEEIDITELEALRKHLNSRRNNPTERLTLLPFLGLALMRALKEFPQCNSTYDKDRNMLLQHEAVHMGVATQTPDGLKVPVIRHAEMKDLDGLAAEIRRVTQAARDNSAKKSDLTGGTITITSLGKLGGIVSTPVINMPEVGIIGVNRAVERPMVFNGQIAVRLMMNLSSSFDHRFVDGYDAAAMIQRIKEMLEHPATIFLP